jgi:hypothetical protein
MTGISRRVVMRVSALGAVVTPFARPGTAEAATVRHLYARARFQRLLGTTFRLSGGAGRWRVALTQVSDLPYGRRDDEKAFSLTLTTRTAGPPQGTYLLSRRGFRPTTLFIVPSDADCRTYQVVINRRR